MLGRQVSSMLLRLPINARLVFRPAAFQCQYALTPRVLVSSAQRYYATPGRPRKAVGEPSRPVKRATKRAARSSDTGEAGRQVREKKQQGSSTRKTATKKKPAPKKRVKKPLTDKQKAVQAARVSREKITELKKQALSPPKKGAHINARLMLLREKAKSTRGSGSSHQAAFGQASKEASQEFKQLTSAELEHYNHLAQQERHARQAEYKRWVESHTPEEIQKANNARAQLKRKLSPKKRSQKYPPIKDERHVKRPVTAYMQFNINRQASGDFQNIPVAERAKLIGKEWSELSESEKKKYKDLQSEDRSRYISEHNDVFGYSPPQAAAAAA